MATRREFFFAVAGTPAMAFIREQNPRPNTSDGFDAVKRAVQSDDDYAWGWHCNIAVAAIDEGVDHATAQKIASRFMGWAFQVDTRPLIHGRTAAVVDQRPEGE